MFAPVGYFKLFLVLIFEAVALIKIKYLSLWNNEDSSVCD